MSCARPLIVTSPAWVVIESGCYDRAGSGTVSFRKSLASRAVHLVFVGSGVILALTDRIAEGAPHKVAKD